MQFKIVPAIVAGLAFTNTAAALSIDDVVDVIDGITKVSGDAADVAKSITNPFSIIGQAPKLINDFREIVQDVLKSVTTLGDASDADFGADEQGRVCDAFHDFVKVHQNLLSIVIGKKGLLGDTPFTAPIGAVLRIVEGGVDKLATAIIGIVPTCKERAQKDQKALDATLDDAVSTYSFHIGGSLGGSLGGNSDGNSGGSSGSAGASGDADSSEGGATSSFSFNTKAAPTGMAKVKRTMMGDKMAADKMAEEKMAEEKMAAEMMAKVKMTADMANKEMMVARMMNEEKMAADTMMPKGKMASDMKMAKGKMAARMMTEEQMAAAMMNDN